ncbi:MAG: GNAT family N-acetyltransferase [Verrucomicrobiales bacterium]
MDVPPSVTLRPMGLEDLAEVSELGIRSKASWGYSPDELAIFSTELSIDDRCLAQLVAAQVAEAGHGELVGYFTLRRHQGGDVELEHLFVEPAWFGKGVGSALFGAALHSAAAGGISALKIVSDPNTTGFYRKFGAREVAKHCSSIAGREIPVLEIATRRGKSEQPSPGPRT